MKINKIFDIPQPSTSAVEDPTLLSGQRGTYIAIECHDLGEPFVRTTINIAACRVLRKVAELYCTAWHLEAYDTMCEVTNSPWVEEIKDATPEGWENRWILKHFMIYLDSVGCYEFIAESVSIENTILDERLNE